MAWIRPKPDPFTPLVPVTNLELPLAKIIDVVMDGVNMENNVNLLVRCVNAPSHD